MSQRGERDRRRERRLEEERRAQGKERRQKMLRLGSAAAFIAVAIVIVLVVVSQSGGGGGDTKIDEVASVNKQLDGIPQNGLTLGDPKAPVTLREFGDLQCPVCAEYSEKVLPQIIDGPVRSGKAKIEFHNLVIIGPDSQDAAKAAVAAGDQGRGWSFIELFYRNQGEENSGYADDGFFTAVAKAARVKNLERWNTARASSAASDSVTADGTKASDLGFNATPSFTVEGPGGTKVLNTPGSADEIETAIDAVS